MKFYIGCYNQAQIKYVPKYFVYSFRQLRKRKSKIKVPANLEWMMDSGAFQEIFINGKYTYDVEEYQKAVLLHKPNVFVNMDFMCEPKNLKKTGLSIKEHQHLSTEHQVKLKDFADDNDLCFMGTLQGWKPKEYLEHLDLLQERGILTEITGVGSICRRAATFKILDVLRVIRKATPSWVKLHGFGVKKSLLKYKETYDLLYSVDSMAWSYAGRKAGEKRVGIGGNLFGKPCLVDENKMCYRHTDDCANCERYMLKWLNEVENLITKNSKQTQLKNYFGDK